MSLITPQARAPRVARRPVRPPRSPAERLGWLLLGSLIVLAGLVIAPLPGPGGIPVIALGLTVILRHSRAARRLFIRAQRRWPRVLTPVRRFLQRKPARRPVAAPPAPAPAAAPAYVLKAA